MLFRRASASKRLKLELKFLRSFLTATQDSMCCSLHNTPGEIRYKISPVGYTCRYCTSENEEHVPCDVRQTLAQFHYFLVASLQLTLLALIQALSYHRK
jgi:hypothetical protein